MIKSNSEENYSVKVYQWNIAFIMCYNGHNETKYYTLKTIKIKLGKQKGDNNELSLS